MDLPIYDTPRTTCHRCDSPSLSPRPISIHREGEQPLQLRLCQPCIKLALQVLVCPFDTFQPGFMSEHRLEEGGWFE